MSPAAHEPRQRAPMSPAGAASAPP